VVYLGIPLSTGKMPKSVFQSMVDKMANKLPAWKVHLFHHSGRLALIKSTLAAMPVYTVISHALPTWVTRGFLWAGSEAAHGRKCPVAWDYVQRPLSRGGLGVKDLKLMGRALRSRWLWLQHSDPSKPWASMPMREDAVTQVFFRASAMVTVRNGASTLFWEEWWLDDQGLQELALDLLATMPTQRRRKRMVQSALMGNSWLSDMEGPLIVPILMQYMQVWELVDLFQLTEGDDMVTWRWCGSCQFSSSSAYDAMFLGHSAMQGAK
jgi:hypothetical protein